ncbi:hypothetical protein D3C77_538430 [compost metagenome]
MVANRTASFFPAVLRSNCLVCTIDECKYKLCGITVAPIIPSASSSILPLVAISVLGIKPRSKGPMLGLERITSYKNTIKMVAISVATIASIFLKPTFVSNNKSRTSSVVISTPMSSGMLNNN